MAIRFPAAAPDAVISTHQDLNSARNAAQPFFRFRKTGVFNVKGKKERVRAFSLLGERETPYSQETRRNIPVPFVDREEELAIMQMVYGDSLQGRPQLVSIQKWPFSAIPASIGGIVCAAYKLYASAQSLDFLDLAKNCSFLNRKLTLVTVPAVRLFLDGHQLILLEGEAKSPCP